MISSIGNVYIQRQNFTIWSGIVHELFVIYFRVKIVELNVLLIFDSKFV